MNILGRTRNVSVRVQLALCAALVILGLPATSFAADVTVTKSANPATPSAVNQNGTIHYTITVNNSSSPTKTLTGVQVNDNLDSQLTVTAGTVHASPVGIDDTYAVIGNTRLFVGQTPPAGEPNVTVGLAGDLTFGLLANDVTVTDSIALTTVSNVATTQGGLITINADGSFIYTPKAGFTGTDTYVYTIKNSVDNTLTDTATITFTVTSMVQYVNSAAGVNGDGRSNTPFNVMSSAQTASAAGDFIYMFASATNYGGITLKTNQQLIGNQVALVVNSLTLKAASGTNVPNIVNGGGNGVTLASNNTLSGFTIGNCSSIGLFGLNYSTLFLRNVSINSTGEALILNSGIADAIFTSVSSSGSASFNVLIANGSGNINMGTGALSGSPIGVLQISGGDSVSYAGSISSASVHSVQIQNCTAGVVVALSGAITDNGTGILLNNNTGATINFTGQITASTGANAAFTATGGGTVSSTNANSTLTTTTGVALNVANTTIGAAGLKFLSINAGTAASGPASGIILNNTGASGSLTVSGDGTNNASGGTIQKTTGPGISLTNTLSPSFTSMSIKNTTQSGINGTTVTHFTFNQGTIDTVGAGAAAGSTFSNIAFNTTPTTATNITGTLTITNSTLNNAFFSGIDIQQAGGTISNANISSNTLTSTTSTTTSTGQGINIVGISTASSTLNITKATIANNVIKNFPLGTGIQVSSSNNSGAAGPTFGIPNDVTNIISITGNTIQGQSAANPMNSQAINFNMTNTTAGSRARGNFDISSNGTVALPVTNIFGSVFAVGVNGYIDVTGTINSNVIVANHIASQNAFGITVATGQTSGGSNAENPTLTVTCNNNNVSQQDGVGILMVARSASASNKFKIQNNTVAKPISGAGGASYAIRVDSGNAASNAAETVCLNISGNTTGGGSNGGTGIGLRRNSAPSTSFGVNGMAATATPNVEAYVNGLNPAGGGTTLISATTGFSNCSLPLLFAQGGVETDAAARARSGCGCGHAIVAQKTAAEIAVETANDDMPPMHSEAAPAVAAPVGSALDTMQPTVLTVQATGLSKSGLITRSLKQEQLKPIIEAALQRWKDAELSAEQIALLKTVIIEVASIPGGRLGEARQGHITIADNAAGYGWYVDFQPLEDSEFGTVSSATRFYTDSHGLPAGHLDLLTTVMHEMGHQLGLQDSYKFADRESLMYGSLTMGERRLPTKGQAKDAVPHLFGDAVNYLTVTLVTIPSLPPGKTCTIKFDTTVSGTATTTPILNQASVNGGNIVGGPFLSNTASTDLNVPPSAFSAQTPPTKGDVGFAYAGYTYIANGTPAPTYALAPTSGALPNNLTLSAAGALSGSPTVAGTFTNIIVRASNVAGILDSTPVTITIAPAMTIAPAALAAATAGTATNQLITVSNGTTPYMTVNVTSFSPGTTGLTAAALTTNTGAGTVTLSGTPIAAGTCTFTVNVTDTVGATLSKNYSLTVNAAISIAPASLASATAGTATNQLITVSGGTTPYTTLNVSAFAAGTTGLTAAALTANAGAGTVTLSGTPTAAGTCTFTVNVTDTAGATLSKNYSLTVNAALSISPAALAQAQVGQSTNQVITISNGTTPYTTLNVTAFVAGGTGLTAAALTANAGAGTVTLNGTPTAAGTCTFAVNVTDTAGATATKNYSLTVVAINITPASLPGATAGTAYSQVLTVNGAGLPLNSLTVTALVPGTTGIVAGSFTPNLATGKLTLTFTPAAAGTATFTVNVTDSTNATASQNFSLTVNPALSIAPAALAAATAGKSTSQNITVSGGTTPYTTVNVSAFSAGTTGLTAAALTPNISGTVALSGTPTAAGTCTFTVNVTDTAGATLTKNYTLTVNAALTIAPAALASATAGTATNQLITVSNGTTPYTTVNVTAFSAGTTGLTAAALTANAGAGTVTLSGTPTAAGTCTFTVNATDTAGATLTKNYSLTVNAALSIAPAALASATAGTATNQLITVSNGTTPYTTLNVTAFSAGTTGLTAAALTANAGAGTVTLSGTPTAAGTCTFTVNVTDTAGATLTKNYSLTVNAAITIAPAALASATAGTATNQLITVSNGTTPYATENVTAFSAGTTGLTAAALTANSGAGTVTLSGTPTAAGTCTFTVNVTDTAGATLSKNYSLTVNAALSIAPAALAGATAGTATNQIVTVSNGTTPYTTLNVTAFSAGTTGLTAAVLTANAGAGTVTLSGTPTAAGTCTFTVNVTDTAGATLSKNYTLTVSAGLSIAPAALAGADAGFATNQPITVSGGTTPYTTVNVSAFSAGTTGLTAANLTANTGAGTVTLSGTPTAAGTCTFTVNATDTAGASTSKNYTLTVSAALSIAPASLTTAVVGVNTNQTITVSNGTTPYTTLNVTAFAAGGTGLTAANLTANAGAGTVALNGTPTAVGTCTFTVNVTDTAGATLSKNYSLTVVSITVTPGSPLSAGTATSLYAQTLTANNAALPLNAFTVSALVPGATGLVVGNFTPNLAAGTLGLSFTPSAAGTATWTVNVTDKNNASVSFNYSLTINAALSIAPAALAQATATKSTSQTITVSGGTTPYTTLNVTAFSAGTTGLTAAALTANAGAGTVTLSGTPTAAGTCTFTVNVTDTAGATLSKNYSLTVNAALSIAPASLAAATATAATNQIVTVSNGTSPYTTLNVTAFSAGTTGLTAAALTANAGAGTVTLSGTPTAAGTCTFTVNVTDTAGATLSKNYSLTVNASISIAPAALAQATAGMATNQTITVSNGTTPYTTLNVTAFSAGTTGVTGAALTANAGAGTVTLSGTPTAAGTCTFTVNVTDTAGATLSKNYSLTVNAAISIAPAALAQATAGTATNQIITVSNGTTPYTTLNVTAFSAGTTGLTAAALTANAGAGTVTLSGTPSAAGMCTFTVNVTDTAGATLSKSYALTVNPALSIAPAALASATATAATNQTITVSNGTTPYTTLNVTAFSAGTTGLTAAVLTANAGAGTVTLSGTPTAAGTCTFTVNVTDTAGATLTKNYSLTVNAALSFSPAALAQATAGTATNQTITVSNGTTPYTTLNVTAFSAGTTGLTGAALTANAGAGTVVLSGTPTAAGTCTFSINVTDTAGATATKNYTLIVNAALSIAPGALAQATAGTATNQTITISNGTTPYTTVNVTAFSAGTTGLTAANVTASNPTVVVNGTPTAVGTCTFTVNVTDTAGATATANYTLTVNAALSIAPAALVQATAGTATNQTITISNGTTPYTTVNVSAFSAGTTGLTASALTANTGAGAVVLSGTATAAGTCTFTVNVTDTAGATLTKNYSLTVNAAITVSPATLPNWTANLIGYSQTITAANGTGAKTLAVSAGSIPTGMIFTAGTGLLNGTPTVPGTFNFTITATDTVNATGSQTYTVVINPVVTVAAASLPNAILNQGGYAQTISATGGTGALTLAVTGGALPPGMSLSPAGLLGGTPTALGTFSFTVTATDSLGATGTQTFTLVVAPPVTFSSAPTAFPNPAIVDVPTAFTAATNPANAVVTWDFGDGSPKLAGSPVSHIYTVAGTYTVTVTAQDPVSSGIVTTTLTLVVNDVADNQSSSLPGTLQITIIQGRIRLYPSLLKLTGTIPFPAGTNLLGSSLTVSVNGLTKTFKLNQVGNVSDASGTLRFKSIKSNPGVTGFSIYLHGGDLGKQLAENVGLDSKGRPKKALIEITLGNLVGSYITPLNYSTPAFPGLAKFGKK